MTIDQAQQQMYKAQTALSKLDALLSMLKVTANYIGKHPEQRPMIDLICVADLLIDQMEELSPYMSGIDCFLNGEFCKQKTKGDKA